MSECIYFKKNLEKLVYYPEEFKLELARYQSPQSKIKYEEVFKKWSDLLERLNSPELAEFIATRLEPFLKDEIISQERIPIPDDARRVNLEPAITQSSYTEIPLWKKYIQTPVLEIVKFFGPKQTSAQGATSQIEIQINEISCSDLSAKKNEGIYGEFYHDGYLAGGAIANLINEFFFNVPAVINDVDYFYYDFRSIKNSTELENEFYEKSNISYKIKKTYRKDLINYIEFESFSKEIWKNLLNSFDLNCTMFGFHPRTKKLLLNPMAIEFLISREIKINKEEAFDIDFTEEIWNTADKLPSFSSLIRALRKSKELNAFFPFNDYIKQFIWKERDAIFSANKVLISHKRSSETRLVTKENRIGQSVVFISKKDIEKLQLTPLLFSPYFEFKQGELHYLHPRVAAFDFFKNLTDNGTNRSSVNDFFVYESYFRYYEPRYPLQDLKQVMYQRFSLLKKYNLITQQTKRCFKEDLLESKLEILSKFLEEHTIYKEIMDGLLRNFGWTFNRCCTLFLKIKKHDQLIGVFEGFLNFIKYADPRKCPNYASDVDRVITLLSSKFENEDIRLKEILKFLDEVYEKNKEKNVLKKKTSLNCYDKWVKELTLATELEKESEKMRHCVRGYSDKVRRGDCRIFHLKTNQDESTLELAVNLTLSKNGRILKHDYTIAQHKAFSNRQPYGTNLKLAALFVRHLNLTQGFTAVPDGLRKNRKQKGSSI